MPEQIETSSVRNQDLDLQTKRFAEFISSNEVKINATSWFRRAFTALQRQKIGPKDWDNKTLVFSPVYDHQKELNEEQLYVYFLLSEAVQLIQLLAPRVGREISEIILPHLVLAWSSEIDDPTAGWSRELGAEMRSIGESTVIILDRLKGEGKIGAAHPYLLQTLVHELLHSYTQLYLQTPTLIPGHGERLEKGTLLEEEKSRMYKHKFRNLADVINEAISLAFEAEVIASIRSLTKDDEAVKYLKLWLRDRVVFLRSTRDWRKAKTDEESNAGFSNYAYYEAYRLGVELKKAHWQLDQIPVLMIKIRKIVEQVTGNLYSGGELETIGYTTERSSKSDYQRILQEIKSLKP